MLKKTALLLSFVFQPLVFPTLIFIYLLLAVPEVSTSHLYSSNIIIMMVAVTTFIVPALSLLAMRFTGSISSIHLFEKEERIFPFSMVCLYYVMSTYFFYLKLEVEPILLLALASVTSCVILLTVVTFFWKISAHMTAISGFLAIMLVVSLKNPSPNLLILLISGILLSGVIASSRLVLNAHKPSEVITGFLLGFSVCFGSFYFFV